MTDTKRPIEWRDLCDTLHIIAPYPSEYETDAEYAAAVQMWSACIQAVRNLCDKRGRYNAIRD